LLLSCLNLLRLLQVVTNKRANETYVLYQCGTPNPVDSADTELGLDANTKVFQIPLVSVAAGDSSAAGFLVSCAAVNYHRLVLTCHCVYQLRCSCKNLRTAVHPIATNSCQQARLGTMLFNCRS
jgi:hypothetical protein